jgi:uncharacterized protein with GYD domain
MARSKEGDACMPIYVTLGRYTQQGITRIKESPARLDAGIKAAEAMGGKVHAWYLTMGQYDSVFIVEFPSDEVCAKYMLSVSALGNLTTQTMTAFTEDEFRKMVAA